MIVVPIQALARDCSHVEGVGACLNCGARRLSVCAVLAEDGLRRLNAISDTPRFQAGEALVREGDPATHLFNVTSGSVRVYKLLPDGRRQIVGFLFPGDFLGLATGDRYAFSAEALEPTTACRFRKTEYRKLLVEQPDLESALLERASHELKAAQDQMLLLGRKTAMERLASFLTDLSRRAERVTGLGEVVHLPMTRAEIADYLGLTTETVSRLTSKLKTRGLIRLLSLYSVRIERPAELAELAGFDPMDR